MFPATDAAAHATNAVSSVQTGALWLIPLLPLVGALVNGLRALFVRWTPGSAGHAHAAPFAAHADDHAHGDHHGPAGSWPAGWIATAFLFASFCVALWLFFAKLPAHGGSVVSGSWTWIATGVIDIRAGLLFDPLSGLLTLVVTGVGSLIHLYSVGYMAHDENRDRYFTYLNLFAGMMLILVLGDSLPLLFVGWEGVGLCSYLLIGFWYTDMQKAIAGKKAFVVNRVGDLGFLLGMFMLVFAAAAPGMPTLAFETLAAKAPTMMPWMITTACLLLFVGACGKSAQFPLYIWLPDAMAGPTPVSALIHAATMVTAGVYMIARLSFLFGVNPEVCAVVATVGAFTALFAASIGFVQNDVKKVLAYSTVSQLGFMVLAVGAAGTGYVAGVYHLTTHAFFKALLFLGSGSLIHAMEHALPHGSDPNDIRSMGGLRHKMPWTFRTFVVGWAAIVGFPLLSGFWSKDEVLATTLHSAKLDELAHWLPGLLFAVGVLAAAFTAFYMTRLLILVFFGAPRMGAEAEKKVHESGWEMVAPMVILAVASIAGGLLWMPLFHWAPLEHFLAPVTSGRFASMLAQEHGEHAIDLRPTIFATAAFAIGTWIAYWIYAKNPGKPAHLAAQWRGLYRMLWNKWFVDEAVDGAIVNPTVRMSDRVLWRGVDAGLIDGTVNGVASIARVTGSALARLQTGLVQNYAVSMALGLAALSLYVLARLYA